MTNETRGRVRIERRAELIGNFQNAGPADTRKVAGEAADDYRVIRQRTRNFRAPGRQTRQILHAGRMVELDDAVRRGIAGGCHRPAQYARLQMQFLREQHARSQQCQHR